MRIQIEVFLIVFVLIVQIGIFIGLFSSIEHGKGLFKWTCFTRSGKRKIKRFLKLFMPALYFIRIMGTN